MQFIHLYKLVIAETVSMNFDVMQHERLLETCVCIDFGI